jgi:hypothetical protein
MILNPDLVNTLELFLFARPALSLSLSFSNPDLVATKSLDVGLSPSV